MPGMRTSQSTTSTAGLEQARAWRRVAGRDHLVALGRQHELQALAQRVVVVHDQDAVATSPLPRRAVSRLSGTAGPGR